MHPALQIVNAPEHLSRRCVIFLVSVSSKVVQANFSGPHVSWRAFPMETPHVEKQKIFSPVLKWYVVKVY